MAEAAAPSGLADAISRWQRRERDRELHSADRAVLAAQEADPREATDVFLARHAREKAAAEALVGAVKGDKSGETPARDAIMGLQQACWGAGIWGRLREPAWYHTLLRVIVMLRVLNMPCRWVQPNGLKSPRLRGVAFSDAAGPGGGVLLAPPVRPAPADGRADGHVRGVGGDSARLGPSAAIRLCTHARAGGHGGAERNPGSAGSRG